MSDGFFVQRCLLIFAVLFDIIFLKHKCVNRYVENIRVLTKLKNSVKREVPMQQKTVSKYTKEQTCEFAKEVLFRHYGSRATQIKYIGGGSSFGYVLQGRIARDAVHSYGKGLPRRRYQDNESAALKKLAESSLVHIPKGLFYL